MSSGGQILGGIIGGAIGFATGNPALGFQVGMMVGGYVDPPDGGTVYGQRLSDLNAQTSTYGAVIPVLKGKVAAHGNIFWLKGNQIDEVVVKKKSGGSKGQPKTTSVNYFYNATFAVSICDNAIDGVSRIWLNGQLYFDAQTDDVNSIYSSGKNGEFFDIYPGTQTECCPEYEADVGVGNAPVYYGMSYIVFNDLPLARFGNSLPSVQIEVVESATFLQQQVLYDKEHDLNYLNHVVGRTQYGLPYIARCQYGAIELATTQEVEVDHWSYQVFDIEGNFQFVDKIPIETPFGALWLNSGDFQVPNTNSGDMILAGMINENEHLATLDTNGTVDLAMADYPLYKTSYFGILDFSQYATYRAEQFPHPTTQGYLRIATVSTDGKKVLIATAATASGLDTYNYWVIDAASGDYIRAGTSATSLGIKSRGRNGTLSGSSTSCLSNDGKYLWIEDGRDNVQVYDIENDFYLEASLDYPNGGRTASQRPCIGESGGTAFVVMRDRIIAFTINDLITSDRVNVSDIIASECARAGITSSEIDVTDIDDTCIGYKVAGIKQVRANLTALQSAYSFDVIQSGYKIKFAHKDKTPVASISVNDFLAVGDSVITHNRLKESDLPSKMSVTYLDYGRNYDANEQSHNRRVTNSVNHVKIEMPIVLTSDEAAGIAEKLLHYAWVERDEFSFSLPAPYSYLEAGDVITVTDFGNDKKIRINKIDYSGLDLVCTGVGFSERIIETSASGGVTEDDDATIVTPTKTFMQIIDAPLKSFDGNDYGVHVAVFGLNTSWSGADVFLSRDNGYHYETLKSFAAGDYAFFGTVETPPTTGKKNTLSIDRETVLNVRMTTGQLYNVTEEHMLNGANWALYGDDGRWEVIKFQRAELQSDGTYNVYNLCRGRSGTEWCTDLHEVQDKFIVYNSADVLFCGLTVDDLSETRTFQAITQGLDDSSAYTRAYNYSGVNLKPLSGVWPTGSRDGSGNLTIGWTRRTRVGGKWKSNTNASLGENTESYEIDILNGSTVVRTLTSSTSEVSYTAAQQTTDFGSTQSVVSCKIYQISAAVGRGYELEANV